MGILSVLRSISISTYSSSCVEQQIPACEAGRHLEHNKELIRLETLSVKAQSKLNSLTIDLIDKKGKTPLLSLSNWSPFIPRQFQFKLKNTKTKLKSRSEGDGCINWSWKAWGYTTIVLKIPAAIVGMTSFFILAYLRPDVDWLNEKK